MQDLLDQAVSVLPDVWMTIRLACASLERSPSRHVAVTRWKELGILAREAKREQSLGVAAAVESHARLGGQALAGQPKRRSHHHRSRRPPSKILHQTITTLSTLNKHSTDSPKAQT